MMYSHHSPEVAYEGYHITCRNQFPHINIVSELKQAE